MTLPNGAYSVTASKSGFTSKTVTGVVVSSGTTTTRNIALSPSTTTGALSGTVRASGTGFPITGATVDATVGSTTYSATTNSSGVYSMSLPAGAYSVTASATGYFPSDPVSVTVSSGTTTTKNFSLEKIACSPCP